jgi:hypothetical protein
VLEIVGEFLDTTVRVALARWFPAWARSAFAAGLMAMVVLTYRHLPGWVLVLVHGHWIAMAITITLGFVGWLGFKVPFLRGARGRLFPWVWSGLGVALVVGVMVSAWSHGAELGFAEWYGVSAWAISQAWYLRQSRAPREAKRLSEAFFLRSLYGLPLFFFTLWLAGGDGLRGRVGEAVQLGIFHAVMMWVNFRLYVRHETAA